MLDPRSLPEAARLRYDRALAQANQQDPARAAEMAEKSLALAGWSLDSGVWIAKARITSDGDRWAARIPIVRKVAAEQLAFGWASVAVRKDGSVVVDHQEDTIRVSQLERAAYGYVLRSRDASDMHSTRGVGALIESCVFTPEKRLAMGLPIDSGPIAWWVGFHVRNAEVWDKVASGEYSELSIGGRGVRREISEAS